MTHAADLLIACEEDRVDREPLTDVWPELDLQTAYAIQDEVLARKVAPGEKVIGVKLGLTSRAKQQRMNVHAPLTGWLTDAMVMPAGVPVPQPELIHPRAEPELVFVLGAPLEGPGVTSATAMAAVDMVYGGLEIIDSRYRDFRFTLPDVVADNASSAKFVIGPSGVAQRSSTSHSRPACSRSTESSSTPPRAQPCRAIPQRPSPSPPTTSRGAACASRPAGSSSPAA